MTNDTRRRTSVRRIGDAVVAGFVRYGIGPHEVQLLTTRGRRTGFLRTTPVSLVDNLQGRFLVAAYGPVGWVHNIRADGFGTLRRGGWIELISVREVPAERAAPVLREYLSGPRAAVVGPYFEARADDPLTAFIAEADRHPVFEIVRSQTIRV
ncbi:nitroreductase family deazaflavin-dependent oxidoreductase [Lipingzhangella sp. LS1_29]|uniref:Nitroreductase family deazaflavin-dependent oxidoreductase n=1 Tax=Lipingzhangella rawalii TaxID=2055835 RepID=A0ABU2H2C9_9ACTN|nr:nitroreductase family deazaflavin-dependent oxidoreductase [Lipingzhangella rawalii]MDS1269458.1 nitroreductase family deazaflavin-dependent oxidoreductase [Lipingzhangella rawalii]